jgi:hypothetical protein
VLTSNPLHLKKNSFRPFLPHSIRASLPGWRADLAGRRARWSQLSLDPQCWPWRSSWTYWVCTLQGIQNLLCNGFGHLKFLYL